MKFYTIDGALLTEKPEIRIGDKIYKVDNRMSTVKRLGDEIKKSQDEEMDITIRLILGESAYTEIMAQDLSVLAMQEIVITISAAVSEITVEEARKRFQSK